MGCERCVVEHASHVDKFDGANNKQTIGLPLFGIRLPSEFVGYLNLGGFK